MRYLYACSLKEKKCRTGLERNGSVYECFGARPHWVHITDNSMAACLRTNTVSIVTIRLVNYHLSQYWCTSGTCDIICTCMILRRHTERDIYLSLCQRWDLRAGHVNSPKVSPTYSIFVKISFPVSKKYFPRQCTVASQLEWRRNRKRVRKRERLSHSGARSYLLYFAS